jgi:hydrogenase maturation factor
MLGLDVLTLTNEGCMLITAARHDRDAVLEVLQTAENTAAAAVIGTVAAAAYAPGPVIVDRQGTARLMRLPHGIGAPRLC